MILIYSDAGLEKVELYKEGIDSRYVHTMIRDSKVRVKILKFLMFNTRRLGTGLIIWLAIFTFFKINYIYLIMITVFNIVLISYTGLKLMIVGIPGDDVENGITIDIVEKTIRIVFMVILIINLSAGYCEGSITQWQPAGIFEKGIEILGVSPVLSKYLSTGEITYNDEKLMVIETSKKRIFHFKQPSILEIPRDDKLYNDMIMVQLNTRKDIKGKKYLSQNKIGKIFGISRQMVNAGRVSPYKKAGEKIQSLIKEHKKSVLTPELRERIIELRIENIHLSTKEIKNLLVSGGHVGEDFVEANIRNALKNIDLNKVISKVRKYFTGKKLGINQSYLIKRLFKIIENNAGDIKEVREEIVGIKDSVKSFEKRERKILKDFAKQEKKYRKNYLLAMIFNDPDVVICT